MSDADHGNAHRPGAGGHEEEHEEHVNHEAWVIPYADMLTLLMALFLMLWATSTVDQQKFAALAESLRDAFGNGTGELSQKVGVGNTGILDGQESGVENGDRSDPSPQPPDPEAIVSSTLGGNRSGGGAQAALEREKARQEQELREAATLAGVQQRITEQARQEGVLESLKFERTERGLVVTVVADNVLFDSGSAVLKDEGRRILLVVGNGMRDLPNQVIVEGHTDNQPISTPLYPTNWELSSHRGTSVLRSLVDASGIAGNRISSAGYGDTRPEADNATAEGRAVNRRVEIVVLSTTNT